MRDDRCQVHRFTNKIYRMNYLKADGFDDAIVGIDMWQERLVYDKNKMIEILMTEMSREEAIEFLEYNVWGAYVGEHTPLYIDLMNLKEIEEL